jgi:hypothetical protein
MDCKRVDFSGHAIQRMFQRGISVDMVLAAVSSGEVIADYPDDTPYPSQMLLGFWAGRPVHVLVAINHKTATCIIVTAYEPQADHWEKDFRKRRVE